ncbi:MAG: hypothetical protein IJR04_03275 [Bacteroidales bacterium]|nr:hypothetical protein [Bacteroidales bacterium]
MSTQKETVGQFQAYELDGFKLHVYNSNDVMFDASYIIEGRDGLVVMEYPLFKVNAAEFAEYIKSLGKPVVTDITDYHLGGSDQLPIVMPEGMPKFIEGPIYGGMMKGFAEQFGETMVDLPTQQATEVPFGSTQNYAGVDFRFDRGAASDFPGSMILIGNQVCYTHWAPYQMHMSPLQLGSKEAIDAELAATKAELATGAKYFIGGHGGLVEKPAVEARIAYLECLKKLRAEKKDAATFSEALKAAYPDMPGDIAPLAEALYK